MTVVMKGLVVSVVGLPTMGLVVVGNADRLYLLMTEGVVGVPDVMILRLKTQKIFGMIQRMVQLLRLLILVSLGALWMMTV
jgi:hypothetical protein